MLKKMKILLRVKTDSKSIHNLPQKKKKTLKLQNCYRIKLQGNILCLLRRIYLKHLQIYIKTQEMGEESH